MLLREDSDSCCYHVFRDIPKVAKKGNGSVRRREKVVLFAWLLTGNSGRTSEIG
jgi:hypothetical protein